MDVGTSFGGIGSSREVMIASLAEPAMIMIVFSLALVAGSTQLSTIATELAAGVGLRVSLGLALVALVMVAIAENGRIPIDNPATHLELTMVHEAMILEYSGRHLAVIELAASLKLLLYISLIACVFVPWGIAPAGAGPAAFAIGFAAYVAKLAVGGVAARPVRDDRRQDARLPRVRFHGRRADARPARHAPPLRDADVPMIGLDFDVAHLLAGGLVLVSFVLLYQDRHVRADQRVRAACGGVGGIGRLAGAACRTRRTSSSRPR